MADPDTHPLTLEDAEKLGTLTLDQVASLLQMPAKEFRARRGRLQLRHDFPRALPGCGNVWSSRLVRAWIDAGGHFEIGAHLSVAPDMSLQGLIESDRRRLGEIFKEP